jgi:hypothetical protein
VESTAYVAIAGILAASIVGPALLSQLSARQRRAERKEDYARQDAVAAAAEDREQRQEAAAKEVAVQAKEAAELLLAEQRATTARTDEVARVAAEATARTDGKLNQIHELVNSTLTGAMQSQLVAMEAQLAMIRRWQPDETTEINVLAEAVAELRSKLADRAKQTEVADAQVTRGG